MLATCTASLVAQPSARWSEFARVTEWEGVLRISGSGSSTSNTVPMTTQEWTESRSLEIRFRLQKPAGAPAFMGLYEGPMTGAVTVGSKLVTRGPISGCVTTATIDASNSPPINVNGGGAAMLRLEIQSDGEYSFVPMDQWVKARYKRNTQCVVPQEPRDEDTEYNWWPDEVPTNYPLPSEGLVLRGSAETKSNALLEFLIGEPSKITQKLEWEIRPAGMETSEDEVVVTIAGYDTWRPEAGPNGGKGNVIQLQAKLQKKGGGAPSMQALQFEWEFPNVSREPGFALNAPLPLAPSDRWPDLRFEVAENLVVTNEDFTRARSVSSPLESSTATVASWDWGGFGEVRVQAVMPDGRRIIGYLEADPGQKDIRLPKRAPGDHIAEIWRKEKKVTGISDWADDDSLPAGDGNRGDGLTLYEEYRGFIENEKHIEGDPDRKDYFVLNKAGGSYLPGILLFRAESDLAVHYEFAPHEFPDSRVINGNHAEGPHRVDQHGVIILAVSPDQTYAIANSVNYRPSTPRDITSVEVPRIVDGVTKPGYRKVLLAGLAHELLHACNVYHHGEDDVEVNWRYKPGTDDFIERNLSTGAEKEIRILRENGSRFAPVIPETGINLWMGVKGGQHSGHDGCLMRYQLSGAYASTTDDALRYKVRESVGLQACSTSVGAGVNHFARDPQSRYGDTSAGRGDCMHQILVNDAVNPPVR